MRMLLVAAAIAATTVSQPITRFVDQTLKQLPDLPGLGIIVVRDGRTIYTHDPDTGYYIGSTTKAYTGLACAILATRGQLDLDAPVSRYLPEVKLTTPLRAFLTHTSALENDAITIRTAYSGEHTSRQLAELLNRSKPMAPGFHYDNLGYVVASLVIERVTGKPWQKAVDDLVFTPLKMTHTTAYMSEAEKWPLATPYTMRNGKLEVETFRKVDATMHAAGGIVTTPADLGKWLNANINKGRVGRKQVIPARAFEEAQRLQVAATGKEAPFQTRGYGFGWYQADYAGNALLVHGGAYEGWQTLFSFMPEQKIGIGVMVNSSGPAARAAEAITMFVYDELLGRSPDATQRLADLRSGIDKRNAAFAAELAKRAQRPWMLHHANGAYAGRYDNDAFGSIVIEERDGHLYATLGRVSTLLEAFTKPETARVELTPGTGSVIEFVFDGDRVTSLRWSGEVFTRAE